MKTAYLVAIFNKEDERLLGYDIWSDPPWDKSRQIDGCYCMVAYAVRGATYGQAKNLMIQQINSQFSYVGFTLPEIKEDF